MMLFSIDTEVSSDDKDTLKDVLPLGTPKHLMEFPVPLTIVISVLTPVSVENKQHYTECDWQAKQAQ